MRPFDDDYDELDEPDFESFAQIRRLVGEKQHRHHKSAGRRHRGRAHHDRWADSDWDSFDDSNDYYDDEIDRHKRLRFDD